VHHEASRIVRQLYVEAMKAYQERWLQQRREQYQAVRWRRADCVTPFGLIGLPPIAGLTRAVVE